MKRRLLFILASTLAVPAAAQDQASPPPDGKDIIVIAKRIGEAQRALAACIARHCPPNQEIDASLALAQEQFKDGDYQAARTALLKAQGRNARYARQYPVAVANLHHASGLVARNLGLADSEWSSALDAISAMKAGLPSDDPRVFVERIELGDAYARAGRFEESANQFKQVASRAHSLGLKPIEATGLLRLAILYTRLASQSPHVYTPIANRAIDAILSVTDPAFAEYAKAARELRVQLDGQGAPADIEARVAAFDPLPAGKPSQLLYAPRIDLSDKANGFDQGDSFTNVVPNASLAHLAMDSFDGQWIDVAFTVGCDGKVSDPHIAKHGKKLQTDWADRVVASIAARRYRRQTVESQNSERYTFTSNWKLETGSHMRVRSTTPRLEEVDLSD